MTAKHTTAVVEAIGDLFIEQKRHTRAQHKVYRQDLMNSLFSQPYTKVAFIEEALGVSRATATRYLEALCESTLSKHKLGRESYYVNDSLVALLFEFPLIE